jgi:hypothetical protein
MAGARPDASPARAGRAPALRLFIGGVLLLIGICGAALAPAGRLPPGDYTPRQAPSRLAMPADRAGALREDALARARVWREPAVPVESADLADNPPGSFRVTDELVCRFLPHRSGGRTPKFQCVLPGGDVIKVKYGRANHERLAEVAGSRLAQALGFGADRMFVVRRVTCWGCPAYPYPRLAWLDTLLADYDRPTAFEHPVIERTLPGLAIETSDKEGWDWTELDKVDEARGGSSRAELDALRLFAVLLNHWDNKAPNQRLACLPGGPRPDGSCAAPFALIHDYGATFGPRRADLAAFTARPIWKDAATCTVSMHGLPFDGGTFPDRRLGEEGRVFLAERLRRLSPEQVRGLFAGARFGETGAVDAWVRAFDGRVRQIVDRAPCHAS